MPTATPTPAEPLAPFSDITRAWFERTFDAPTSAQTQGWAAIAGGSHTLILAPTGSGKTLAAFLWALDRLHATPRPADPSGATTRPKVPKGGAAAGGVRVLYISPLKALIYDVVPKPFSLQVLLEKVDDALRGKPLEMPSMAKLAS